jgi:hypothetical protein
MIGTATVTCGPTLRASVNVLKRINEGFYEVEVITGAAGWNKPGKILVVRTSIMSDFVEVGAEPVEPVEVPEPAPLTEPIDGEAYIKVLLARQAAWIHRHGGDRTLPPLLEWFIQAGDEDFVIVPDEKPAPKRERRPRTYRSAASLIEERDEVQARMDAITGAGSDDPASVNLSPNARSRAARTAGRQRFEQLDRDLERYTALANRLERLGYRIKAAQAREAGA